MILKEIESLKKVVTNLQTKQEIYEKTIDSQNK